MSKPTRPGQATPRRDFLRTLALAPAAAALAAGGAAASGAGARQTAPSTGAGSPPAAAAEEKSLQALRAHPLPMDAEPALIFRAAPARPVE